ncbi:hypothetical protein L798_12919 [Zootermopsis nevadensis]|uniref:Uncharacterized protein n=1 Tax=Zootermopsis nevadensis TaxID=136037 RepID=A0A067RJ67_ZOONE|nr:hypothetical protein L798_12919 [Zootermopsis nevadensis]
MNVFGGKGPSAKYGAPDSRRSGFGGQRSSGKEPSGTYDATSSGGSGFSGPYEGKRFGGRPLSADGAPSSSSGDPSNIYLPTAGGVGKPSELSGGFDTQVQEYPLALMKFQD